MQRSRLLFSTVTASLVLAGTAAAQKKTETHFGVLLGGAFDKPGGKDATTINGTFTGFALGGFVTIQVSSSVAIEPEALFVQKGAKISSTEATGKIKLPYIEVPLLLKLRIPAKGGSMVSPHAYAGPAVGFRTGCSVKITSGPASAATSCTDPSIDFKVKSTDFGLVFGGGVDIGRALIDVRYNLGLTKLGDSGSNDDVKNRTIYVLAGWTFRSPH